MRGASSRLTLVMAASSLVPTLVALALIWRSTLSAQWRFAAIAALLVLSIGSVTFVASRSRYRLRTISNLIAALREGDFSFRARQHTRADPFDEVVTEVNLLAENLRRQRVEDLEATALVREVMAEIDVAVFTFDAELKLRLVNQRGERLLRQPVERLLARSAADLGLSDCLSGDSHRLTDLSFPGGPGRWEVRRGTFRAGGLPHHLLVLSDLTSTLREEERQAWQRLIQVLRHEINNSLAPIDSLAQSLGTLLSRDPRPWDWEDDVREGLGVIRERSKALNRFMTAYTRLTRLPEPRLIRVEVETWVRRVADLESRMPVTVAAGPALTINADGDQLEIVSPVGGG